MTREKMIEAMAATLWKVQSIDAGTPERVTLGRTPEAFANEDALTRKQFTKYAAAVLDLCGPKKLVWDKSSMSGWNGDYHTLPTAYTVRCADENGWKWSRLGWGAHGWEPSPESAQAAAQAHADAAHWANTPIGDLK